METDILQSIIITKGPKEYSIEEDIIKDIWEEDFINKLKNSKDNDKREAGDILKRITNFYEKKKNVFGIKEYDIVNNNCDLRNKILSFFDTCFILDGLKSALEIKDEDYKVVSYNKIFNLFFSTLDRCKTNLNCLAMIGQDNVHKMVNKDLENQIEVLNSDKVVFYRIISGVSNAYFSERLI